VHGPLPDRVHLGRRGAHLGHPALIGRARVAAARAAEVPSKRAAPRPRPARGHPVGAAEADGSTPLIAALLVAAGAALVVGLVVVLRSRRAREGLYHADARVRSATRLGPAEPEVFVRRFELGVYVGMCLGLALVFLGLVVAAT
jgi:hypothetical protein